MKRLALAFTALLVLAAPGYAQDPRPPVAVIHGPTEVAKGVPIILDARESVSGKRLHWEVIGAPGVVPLKLDDDGREDVVLMVLGPPVGTYEFRLTAKNISSVVMPKDAPPAPEPGPDVEPQPLEASLDVERVEFQAEGKPYVVTVSIATDVATHRVTVVDPTPVPPPPPTPPGPTPPGPTPPAPNPVPVAGLRVILIWESSAPLSAAQGGALFSSQVRQYLSQKCVMEDGRAGWRFWDKDLKESDLVGEPELWKKFWAAVKPAVTSLPCVAIADGQSVTYYPITDEATLLETLKKHGG